jgi:hypothetical protein
MSSAVPCLKPAMSSLKISALPICYRSYTLIFFFDCVY